MDGWNRGMSASQRHGMYDRLGLIPTMTADLATTQHTKSNSSKSVIDHRPTVPRPRIHQISINFRFRGNADVQSMPKRAMVVQRKGLELITTGYKPGAAWHYKAYEREQSVIDALLR